MLTAKLVLERLNKRGELLERREQQSRSFTRGLIDLLYTASLQAQAISPYPITGVDLCAHNVNMQATSNSKYSTGHLRIGAPAGHGCVIVTANETAAGAEGLSYSRANILGNDLGIIVGIDNTAVVPLDRRLGQRIGHGRRPADGGPVLFESYADGEDSSYNIDDADEWGGQEFIPTVSHRVTSVWVKIYKAGAPGDLTVSIRGSRSKTVATVDYQPALTTIVTGTIAEGDIPAASPGALTQCVFATPADLYAGHRYYIVLNCPGAAGANDIYWRYDTAGATYTKAWDSASTAITRKHTSPNTGETWTDTTGECFMFEEWGQSIGEFEYGGCELSNLNFADPDGEFTIRRYLENHCGAAITVNEVGITAVGVYYSETVTYSPFADTFLIARDIVGGGIAVADGELLRVTYVPQITV